MKYVWQRRRVSVKSHRKIAFSRSAEWDLCCKDAQVVSVIGKDEQDHGLRTQRQRQDVGAGAADI